MNINLKKIIQQYHISKHKGMTLVEVIIAISIFLLIIVAVGIFQVNVFSNQKAVSGSFQTSQDAQIILKTIIREIRSMSASANGSYPIVNASNNSLTFYSDTNNDNLNEEITYRLIGNIAYRVSIAPTGSPAVYNPANQSTTTLISNVRNSTSTSFFEYFDENYTGTSTALSMPVNVTAIRLIKVNLTLDIDPYRSPIPVSYSAQINLRNLKTNL